MAGYFSTWKDSFQIKTWTDSFEFQTLHRCFFCWGEWPSEEKKSFQRSSVETTAFKRGVAKFHCNGKNVCCVCIHWYIQRLSAYIQRQKRMLCQPITNRSILRRKSWESHPRICSPGGVRNARGGGWFPEQTRFGRALLMQAHRLVAADRCLGKRRQAWEDYFQTRARLELKMVASNWTRNREGRSALKYINTVDTTSIIFTSITNYVTSWGTLDPYPYRPH